MTINNQPIAFERRDAAAAAEGVYALASPFPLHHGGVLNEARLAWRLTGKAGQPLIVAIGGISGHRRVFDPQQPRNGWWHELVGPGRALDSARLRILGIDYLGGSGQSSAPAVGEFWPSLSSYDQATALQALLEHLQLGTVDAIVGASYGAMVALAFGERFPQAVKKLIVISGADRAHPMASAWRCVQRQTVRFAISAGRAAEGLELARALAMSTYRSPEEFAARFSGPPERSEGRFVLPVEQYLFARGRDYAGRYRAETFLCLSESIDLHRVDATAIRVPTLAIGVREDQLVPLEDMRALVARLPESQLVEISSLHGHDAFLKESGLLRSVFACLYGES
ncbi:MAG: homoserine O-succinyltransferase [Steroidobacteraceae bacterium]